MRLLNLLIPTLASVILFSLTFPLTRIRVLAWVALVPYLVALRRARLREALLLGGICGVLSAYSVGLWFPTAFSSYYDQPLLLGVAFFFGVALVMVVPYYVIFAGAYWGLVRRFHICLPLMAAAAWVAADLGRGRLLTGWSVLIGNPWALFGYSQVGFDPLVQIASITGVYGITFVLLAVNAGFAELWIALQEGGRAIREALFGLGLAGMVAAGALVFGHAELALGPTSEEASPATKVALVQGNLDLGSRWRSDFYGRNLDVYLRLTLQAIRSGSPEIVFWPEAAMTFFLEEEPLYRSAIRRVLGRANSQLVAGGPAAQGSEKTEYLNRVYLLSPEAEILGHYDKEYLVPFSEYFPFDRLDFLRRAFERVRVFKHGGPSPLLPSVAGAAGVLVCNEAMFPEIAARRVERGATYLINPSNDTWINTAMFVALHKDMSSLRAIEQRRYLIRISTAGPSAIIDPWGRTLVQLEHGDRDMIQGMIRPRVERSVYNRVGDLFALLCLAAVILGFILRRPGAQAKTDPES